MPKLIVSLPDGSSVTHELSENQISVGRISDNMIQIEDASVSSHHAEFNISGDQYTLKDLDSTNGTQVNGKPFSEGAIRDGYSIRFGTIETRYASDNPSHAQPLPAKEEIPVEVGASSSKPSDFSNASPFKTKTKKKDPVATALLAFAGFSVLVFLGAVFSVFQLQPPQ
jgi:predicted component of type VI protein secretion system